MRVVLAFFLSFLVYTVSKSQHLPNPYASIGKPAPQMATLSGGIYDEFLLMDSIALINGDVVSRRTGEFLFEADSAFKSAYYKNQEESFRFLSVDPLAKNFPWYTPYQFAGNKPIAAIDLDGAEEYIVHYYFNAKHEVMSIRVVAFVDVKGVAQENNIHHKGKDLITDPNKKVLVFKHYENGTSTQSFENALTPQELEIFNDKKLLKKEQPLTNNVIGTGFEYENGSYVGVKFDSNYKIKISQKEMLPKLVKAKEIDPDDDLDGTPTPLMNQVNKIKSLIDKSKDKFNKDNPAYNIATVKIQIRTGTGNDAYAKTVVDAYSKAYPDSGIKLIIDTDYKPTEEGSAYKYNIEVKITGEGK